MIVCKFGGSCLSSYDKLKLVSNITKANKDRKLIIVSAVGKSNKSDKKITDLLIELNSVYHDGDLRELLLDKIQKKFLAIIQNTKIEKMFLNEFYKFKRNLRDISNEYVISRGEFFTAKIIAEFLNFDFVDSANFMIFNNKNGIDFNESKKRFLKLNIVKPTVIPGFYGADLNGNIKLFQRGGSDTSGALIASFFNNSKYENYTDVGGIFTADPNLYKNVNHINFLSYSQCYKLSNEGARVITNNALLPLVKRKTPLEIIDLKSRKKTLVSSKSNAKLNFVSNKKNLYLLKITLTKKDLKNGIIINILKVFTLNKITVEHVRLNNNKLLIYFYDTAKIIIKKLKFKRDINITKVCLLTLFSSKNKLKRIVKKHKTYANEGVRYNYNFTKVNLFFNKYSNLQIKKLIKEI